MVKEQLYKIWRRCAPPFFRYPQKTSGGADTRPPPPAGARVNSKHPCNMNQDYLSQVWDITGQGQTGLQDSR